MTGSRHGAAPFWSGDGNSIFNSNIRLFWNGLRIDRSAKEAILMGRMVQYSPVYGFRCNRRDEIVERWFVLYCYPSKSSRRAQIPDRHKKHEKSQSFVRPADGAQCVRV